MRTIILQRLCMFVAMCVTMIGARAEWSETFTASNFSDPLSEISKGNVTITFSDAEISNEWTVSNRNFEMRKSSTMTVSVPSGYRIREIYCYDDVKPGRYLTSETSGYAATWDEDKEGKKDNNGYKWRRLYSYDAPASSVTAKNSSSSETCEFRHIKVTYVETPKLSFAQSQYTVYAMSANFTPAINRNGHDGSVTYSSDNTNYAIYNTNGSVSPQYIGTTTLRATFAATANYAKGQCTTKIVVNRDPVTFSFKSTPPKVLFSEGSNVGRIIYNFYGNVNVNTGSEQGFQSANTEFSLASSNTSVISEPNRTTGILTFGGTTGTATVTMKQADNNRYAAASLSHTFTVVRTDADGTVLIGDLNEWKMFASLVNNEGMTTLNAKLDADIDLGSDITTVGTRDKKYSGTFDGQGHTIHINWNSSAFGLALFNSVENVTIKNVRTTGQITTSGRTVAGLVYENYGTSTVTGCISEVNITATGDAGPYSSGLVENIRSGSNLTINDCVVSGTFSGSKHFFSGFVYYTEGTCTLNNCLYVGSNDAEFGYTFAYKATVNNCYYLNTCGDAQGTQVTAEQLKSGEVAYLLQNGRTDNVWGLTIGTDTVPQLTADATRHVNKVTFTKDEQPIATHYANTGKAINGSLPTVQEILGDSYDVHHYYTLAFADGFNESTAVTADKTVAAILTDNEYFEIATKEDWKTFCDLVNGGQTALNGKLTKDINLGSDINMVGTYNVSYKGMFDGDGHSITISWENKNESDLAPFRLIEEATIKNLRTMGSLSAMSNLSGLVYEAVTSALIQNCVSDVDLIAAGYNGRAAAYSSGILHEFDYKKNKNMLIKDCIVSGTFSGAPDEWSGFSHGSAQISNCLYIGTAQQIGNFCHTIGYTYATCTNCYYLNACGSTLGDNAVAQGTQVTEDQLKSGYVAKLLQAGRTDKCFWAQQLGEMPSLYDASKEISTNYVYWHPGEQQWYCYKFNSTGYLPIGLDFYAAQAQIDRSVTADKAYTVSLPFEWGNTQDKIYTLSSVDESKGIASFREVTNYDTGDFENFKAYHPYLVIPKSNRDRLGPWSVFVKAEPDTPVTIEENGVQWCATYEGLTNEAAANANAYILQGDGLFHKVTTDNTAAVIPPYRAYLTIPNALPGKKRLSIAFDNDNTTSLRAIETTDADGTVRYYDLQGRYIGTTLDRQPEGIYVGGGKKVIKK